MCDILYVKDGHLSNMHKYSASLTFNYFASEALRKSKRLLYSMWKLNLFIELKINRPDIYLFHGKWDKKEFFKREPVFIHVSFWMAWRNIFEQFLVFMMKTTFTDFKLDMFF